MQRRAQKLEQRSEAMRQKTRIPAPLHIPSPPSYETESDESDESDASYESDKSTDPLTDGAAGVRRVKLDN